MRPRKLNNLNTRQSNKQNLKANSKLNLRFTTQIYACKSVAASEFRVKSIRNKNNLITLQQTCFTKPNYLQTNMTFQSSNFHSDRAQTASTT